MRGSPTGPNQAAAPRSCQNGLLSSKRRKLGCDLGPLSAEYHTKPCCIVQDQARRIINIAFWRWSPEPEVGHSSRPRRAIYLLGQLGHAISLLADYFLPMEVHESVWQLRIVATNCMRSNITSQYIVLTVSKN